MDFDSLSLRALDTLSSSSQLTPDELERAKAIQASSLQAGGPMKIRTDYVPKRKIILFYSNYLKG